MAAEMIGIRNVPGAIAELGVYQGETAAFLNSLFPDRILHLFDTFEGFVEADVSAEVAQGYSEAHAGDFKDTDVARVLARLPHPDQVTLHQGFFPATTEGVEATFALVSLDVDLYAPTLAGLEWFYKRLNPGGYIFIHDYNNLRYMGVRHAVDDFLTKVSAPVVALPDFAGSLIVLK
ncbi:MAG: TylF/MycF/NovP-related O-methyltransferase [Negativicutes bacterium]|nr:TylF/MycF/NovP-related O-methyltransferase [Negativicutes bacterium]